MMLPEAERPTIRADFRDLIPPLGAEERAQLEADIVTHGCREPLVLWRGFLVDGHNRLEICESRGVPYSTVDYSESSVLVDESAVLRWICDNQLQRRNLTPLAASYLRGKRYLMELERRNRGGQSGPRGSDGTFQGTGSARGRTSDVVAAEQGVGSRTVKRDAQFAQDVDTVVSAVGDEGTTARGALLRGELRCTRRTLHEVAVAPPADFAALRDAVTQARARQSSWAPAPTVKPAEFFQRAIKEFIRDDAGNIVAVRLAVCGHVQPYKARAGAVSGAKTKSCRKCGSGSRPAFERFRRRVQLEAVVRVALKDSTRFQALCDFVDAGVSVLSIAPMTEHMRETWARLDRAAIQGQLVDAPTEAEAR
jgi:hypothetical protein